MFRKNRKTKNQTDSDHGLNRGDVSRDSAESEKSKLEKGDLPAMYIAAFGVFLPVLITVTVLLIGLLWFLFIR